MQWEYNPYTLPLFTVAGIGIIVTWLAWRRRDAWGGKPFLVLAAAATWWSFFNALEIGATTMKMMSFWARVEYVGISTVPAAWLALALEYVGLQRHLTRRNLSLLAIIPILIQVATWTNGSHHLMRQDEYLDTSGLFDQVEFTPGPLYWINVLWAYSLLIVATYLIIRLYVRVPGPYRGQAGLLVAAAFAPWIGNMLYLFKLSPWVGLDLTPIAFILSAILVLWDLIRYQFLDLSPVARDLVIESMSDLVIVLDRQWRIVDLNQAAQHIMERSPDQVIGKSIEEAFPTQLRLVEQYRDVTKAYAEVSLGNAKNQRHYDLRLSALQDWRGQLAGTLVVLRDISERKRAEKNLQESNERLSILRRIDAELTSQLDVSYVLFNAMDAAIRMSYADAGFIGLIDDGHVRVVQATGGYMQYVNTNFPTDQGIMSRVVRTQAAELVQDVSVDPDYRPLLPNTRAQMTLPLISRRRFLGVLNLETHQPDYFTEDNFEFIKLLGGRIAVALDNARAYQEQERLVEELDAFAHTVAHDLKNPLNVTQGYAQILIDYHQKLNPEMELHWLKSIVRSTQKMFEIIEALMLLAGVRKMENVPIETINMQEIVADVCERLEMMVQELNAEVILPSEWPAAKGYTPWIAEVVTNYFSNALKYGGTPPRVELGATPEDGYIKFWVRDNGAGLSPEQQAQLFRPFTRLGQQTEVEGHGLGLSIVHRIVEKLGGQVGIESEKGAGSVFSFSLPSASHSDGEGV